MGRIQFQLEINLNSKTKLNFLAGLEKYSISEDHKNNAKIIEQHDFQFHRFSLILIWIYDQLFQTLNQKWARKDIVLFILDRFLIQIKQCVVFFLVTNMHGWLFDNNIIIIYNKISNQPLNENHFYYKNSIFQL